MKPKEEIPVHLINTHLKNSFFVKYYESIDNDSKGWMNVRHRDEYFIFLLVESGTLKLNVDFRNIAMEGSSIFYIKPGQVHDVHFFEGKAGWVLAVEPGFLHRSYRQELEKRDIDAIKIDANGLAKDFESLINMIKTVENLSETASPQLRKDLVNSMIGIILGLISCEEDSVKDFPERWNTLYNDFRLLVTKDFRTVKKPSEYAEHLHISLSYLNEVVKSISGFTVSYWINNEIVLEAKRLLHYTSLAVKEISYELGYEDPAYLSRIFTNNTGMSPNAFRKKNRE